MPLLSISDLHVSFRTSGEAIEAVRGVSLEVGRAESVALVGESGSGKSVTALSVLRLLPHPQAWHPGGRIEFDGESLLDAPPTAMRSLRGRRISMIFQEPMTSLNPLHTVEKQVREALRLHQSIRAAAARERVLELLDLVHLRDAELRLASYPHQLSGGQRQRVMIAMALANDPDLLIADEPTTALDVTIQAQILDLMRTLQRESAERMSIVFITHDLGVVADTADRVVVMYGGRIVEEGTAVDIFKTPRHPYTIGLLNSIPRSVRQGTDADPDAIVDYRLEAIPGNVPNPMNLPPGCAFEPRCGYAVADCGRGVPTLAEIAGGHHSRCIRWAAL